MSVAYEWHSARQVFTSRQYVATQGAKAVLSLVVHSVNYLVFANSFDSVSQTSEIKFVLHFTNLLVYFMTYSETLNACNNVFKIFLHNDSLTSQ